MERCDRRRIARRCQARAQEIGEQMVIAEPVPLGIERDQEQVRRLDRAQQGGTVAPSQDGIGERRREAIEDGAFHQEGEDLRRLAIQHVPGQEFGDFALAARKMADEIGARGALFERERGQLQAGDPALGAMLQGDQISHRQIHGLGLVEQTLRLVQREAQLHVVEIDELALHPHVGEAEGQGTARRHHQMQAGRRIGQQRVEEAADLGCFQELAIVQHQEKRAGTLGKVVDDRCQDEIDREQRA